MDTALFLLAHFGQMDLRIVSRAGRRRNRLAQQPTSELLEAGEGIEIDEGEAMRAKRRAAEGFLPATMWAVVDNDARSLRGALAVSEDGKTPAGRYFIALFYYRRFADAMAKKWIDGKVVKVRVTEVKNK